MLTRKTDDIEGIRSVINNRKQVEPTGQNDLKGAYAAAHRQRVFLLGEVDRLKAELDRLSLDRHAADKSPRHPTELRLWLIDDGERHYVAAPTIDGALSMVNIAEEADELTVTEVKEEKARTVNVNRDDEGLPQISLWDLYKQQTTPAFLSSSIW